MLIKPGVDIRCLDRPIRRALNPLDKILKNYGQEMVITSTCEGTHSPSSLHYAGRAIDIRLPVREKRRVISDIKNVLGIDYDVVEEVDHIHIEYDPKNT